MTAPKTASISKQGAIMHLGRGKAADARYFSRYNSDMHYIYMLITCVKSVRSCVLDNTRSICVQITGSILVICTCNTSNKMRNTQKSNVHIAELSEWP